MPPSVHRIADYRRSFWRSGARTMNLKRFFLKHVASLISEFLVSQRARCLSLLGRSNLHAECILLSVIK